MKPAPLALGADSADATRPRAWRGLMRVGSVAVFAGAVWLIWLQVRTLTPGAFFSALAATPPWAVALSVALTGASYACLAGSEWLALRALGQGLSYAEAARVAVPAYALTNSAGFSPVTGAALRLQLYGRKGIGAKRSGEVALLAGTAVTLSGLVTAGLLILLHPLTIARATGQPAWTVAMLGALLAAPAALWFVAFSRRAPRWLGGGREGPGARTRALGLAAGIGDWLFSCAALLVLLPAAELKIFPGFLAAYVAGSVVSAATGVPGGIGVFEAIVLALTPLMAKVHETAAALLLYRCVYSLGPLAIWGLVVAWSGLRRGRRA